MAPGIGLLLVYHVLAFCWPVFAQPILAEPWVVPQAPSEPRGYQEQVPKSLFPAENAAWGPSEEQRWRQQQTALQSGRRSLSELQQVLGAPAPQDPSAVRALSIVHSLAAQQRFRQAKAALVAAKPLLDEAVLHQEVNLLRFEMGEAPPFLTNLEAADDWLAARIPLEEARATVRPDGTLQTQAKLTSTGRLKQMTSDQLAMALDFAERLGDSRMTRRPLADEPVFAHVSSGRRLEGESPLSPRRRSPVLAETGSEEPLARSNAARTPKRHLVLVQVLALTLGCFVLVIACGRLRYAGSLARPSWMSIPASQTAEGSDSTAALAPSKDWIEDETLKLPLPESNSDSEMMKDWHDEELMKPEEGRVIEHAIYTPDGSPVHRFAPVGLLVTPMQLPQLFQATGVQLPNGQVQGAMLLPVPGAGQPQILPAVPYCMGTVIPAPRVQDAPCMSIAQVAEPVPEEEPTPLFAKVSNEAMARLLDVAVLLGDKDACLGVEGVELLYWDVNGVEVIAPRVLDAALAVGMSLFHLHAPIAMGGLYASYWSYAMSYGSLMRDRGISLREAMVLSGDQKILEQLSYEPEEAPRTRHADALLPLGWLMEAEVNGRRKVSSTRLELVRSSGLGYGRCLGGRVRAQPFWMETTHADTRARFTLEGCTMLDLCIYGGQTRCAGLGAGMGASLGDLSRIFLEPDCIDLRVWLAHGAMDAACRVGAAPLAQRRAAAAQALGKALKASMHQASQRMGLGLEQALGAWANGKKVPHFLASKILTFASERPAIADQLQAVACELGLQWDASQAIPQVLDRSEGGVGRWADHAEESSGNSEAEGPTRQAACASPDLPTEDHDRQLSACSREPARAPLQDSDRQVSVSNHDDAVASAVQEEPSNKRAQDVDRRKRKKAGRRKKEAPKAPRKAEATPPASQQAEEEPKRVIRLEELLGLHLKPTDGRKDPGPPSGAGDVAPAVLSRQTSQDTDTARPVVADEHDAVPEVCLTNLSTSATGNPMTSSQKPRRRPKPQAALASAPPPRSGRQWRAGQRHVAAEEGPPIGL
eukprot:s1654_g3.t5